MTTTANGAAMGSSTTGSPAGAGGSGGSERGIFGGITARIKAGRATGWGVFHAGSSAMILGGLMLIISAFLPWVVIPIAGESFALRGTDGPGVVTLAVGFLAFAGGFVPKRGLAIAHAIIPGALVALIVGAQTVRLIQLSAQTGSWGGLLPGMGLILAAGGAVVLIRVAVRLWRARPAA
ncbi:hypothetical protein [Nesterenkonia sp. CL21]|uniref:hypothetical protein n=1 Tax=unclassified Nesterenkonia TaxID=2629769 RepID=UPI0028799339|nr:hypothetical protein [Nesterenkonia sp. CL21]MDS2174152.1 hypothetical protein [Nesterenkonia sp. CL21]